MKKLGISLFFACWSALSALAVEPVYIALDAEFGHKTSTSAQAVQKGMEVAMDEINQAGGVLGGRKLALVVSDNRSIPGIGVDNLRRLAADKAIVGVFGAKYSPVVAAWVPVAQELKIPVFATWSSANPITDEVSQPSYVFRLSLKDAWAANEFLRFARQEKQATRIGVILPNSSWGRSNQAALEIAALRTKTQIVGHRWYNWGDRSLIAIYKELLETGAQAIILIANEGEGAALIKEMAELPEKERLPIISHWGVTGGAFTDMVGNALQQVDFSVIQTYSFIGDTSPTAHRVLAALKTRYGLASPEAIVSPVGVAHAYDLVHLLARAIDKAGSTDRAKVRAALENLGPYQGLVRRYNKPFTPARHDALSEDQTFMARYNAQGVLIPLARAVKH